MPDTRSPEEILREERRRRVREKWMHLLLLGFALSIVLHVLIMLRLWWIKLPDRIDDDRAPAEIVLAELPPTVEAVDDQIELPDPSSAPIGPVTTEMDPNPMSAASSETDPNLPAGTIEAPGIGAIAGAGGAGSGIGIGSGRGGGGTSFFGVGGRGTRFAYIVDISGSMVSEVEDRLTPALAELRRSISALPDYTSFYVVLFADGAYRPDFELSGWLKATRANKSRMAEWLGKQEALGATVPLQAFDIVFKLPQPPDVIFFLTDGLIPGETNYHVDNYTANLKREVVINTIGFSAEAGKEPLQEMARKHRGVFRFVPTRGARSGGKS